MEALCCDYCGDTHRENIIVEKPERYGYKGEISYTGRKRNICVDCLILYLDVVKTEHKL